MILLCGLCFAAGMATGAWYLERCEGTLAAQEMWRQYRAAAMASGCRDPGQPSDRELRRIYKR